MTTFEHVLLGVNGALVLGLHERFGWQAAALAGVAAAAPDWDGLTILAGAALFADAHRVWGHNLLACALLGLAIAAFDHRYDLITRGGRLLARMLPGVAVGARVERGTRFGRFATWTAVAVLAAVSHLAMDMLFSGTATLSDWELQLLWPFSSRGWVFPLVPWGDVGVSVIFFCGMFAMIAWRSRLRLIAGMTLLGVIAYIMARGTIV
jgi:membrane-bound metal-dependent hydrolase YbcI (DUF457 family)